MTETSGCVSRTQLPDWTQSRSRGLGLKAELKLASSNTESEQTNRSDPPLPAAESDLGTAWRNKLGSLVQATTVRLPLIRSFTKLLPDAYPLTSLQMSSERPGNSGAITPHFNSISAMNTGSVDPEAQKDMGLAKNTSSVNIRLGSTKTDRASNTSPDMGPEKSPKCEDTLISWSGPDDPQNPQNMPQWKKWVITWLLSFLNVWVTFSSTIFASAVQTTSLEYGVSRVVMTLGVSLTVLVRLSSRLSGLKMGNTS